MRESWREFLSLSLSTFAQNNIYAIVQLLPILTRFIACGFWLVERLNRIDQSLGMLSRNLYGVGMLSRHIYGSDMFSIYIIEQDHSCIFVTYSQTQPGPLFHLMCGVGMLSRHHYGSGMLSRYIIEQDHSCIFVTYIRETDTEQQSVKQITTQSKHHGQWPVVWDD